ncbi:MAG: DUF6538 domain-containing protein [Candidatus Puniceispirillaceae bacterium]
MAKYLFTKRGIYYFERRVPKDISAHYSASKIIKSLRTKNRTTALALSAQYARHLDGYWISLRHSAFAEQFCTQRQSVHSTESTSSRDCIKMSEACHRLGVCRIPKQQEYRSRIHQQSYLGIYPPSSMLLISCELNASGLQTGQDGFLKSL